MKSFFFYLSEKFTIKKKVFEKMREALDQGIIFFSYTHAERNILPPEIQYCENQHPRPVP